MSDDYSSNSNDNDAGGSGPSDSGSSGGTDWGNVAWEAAGQLFQNLDDTVRPSAPASGGTDGGPPLLNPALQRLFNATGPVQDRRSRPRRVMDEPRWYVLVDDAGRDLLTPLPALEDDPRARLPFARRPARGGNGSKDRPAGDRRPAGKRADRASQPVPPVGPFRAAQAFGARPGPERGLAVRETTPRALAEAMPVGADGVLFRPAAGEIVGLLRDEWPLLAQIADACDLEAMLARPGPNQAAALAAARWYVAAASGLRPQSFGSTAVIYLYTHPEHAERSDGRLTAMTGQELAERLATRDDYDGVMVNIGGHVGEGDDRIHALQLGPRFWPALLRGEDARPGVGPLPARTVAEAHLWLDFAGFLHPVHGRELVPVAAPEGDMRTFVQARTERGDDWRIVETAYRQPARPGPTLGPVFAISQPDAPPGSLGDGTTQILCAGHLANRLWQGRFVRAPRWFVAKRHRVWAAQRGTLAHELRKLLPPGEDALPRSSIRTVEGAALLRANPQMGSRAWIEEQCAYFDGVVRRGWLGI